MRRGVALQVLSVATDFALAGMPKRYRDAQHCPTLKAAISLDATDLAFSVWRSMVLEYASTPQERMT
jgi:hypothetical protein